MEQQLINNLICLIRKAGGESFIKNLLVQGDNVNRTWSADELSKAVTHTQWINDFFGQSDAAVVISKLLEMYSIDVNDLSLHPSNR